MPVRSHVKQPWTRNSASRRAARINEEELTGAPGPNGKTGSRSLTLGLSPATTALLMNLMIFARGSSK
jgi:hypothetical protein